MTDKIEITDVEFNNEKRTTEQKIGKATYIVSSSFSNGNKGDIVSKIARLIQQETDKTA